MTCIEQGGQLLHSGVPRPWRTITPAAARPHPLPAAKAIKPSGQVARLDVLQSFDLLVLLNGVAGIVNLPRRRSIFKIRLDIDGGNRCAIEHLNDA